MDYGDLLHEHVRTGADVTLGTPRSTGRRLRAVGFCRAMLNDTFFALKKTQGPKALGRATDPGQSAQRVGHRPVGHRDSERDRKRHHDPQLGPDGGKLLPGRNLGTEAGRSTTWHRTPHFSPTIRPILERKFKRLARPFSRGCRLSATRRQTGPLITRTWTAFYCSPNATRTSLRSNTPTRFTIRMRRLTVTAGNTFRKHCSVLSTPARSQCRGHD
jgi:hypothetical protein